MRGVLVRLAVIAMAAILAAPARAVGPPYPVNDEVRSAQDALRRKDYPRALQRLESALAKDPKDVIALAIRGNVYVTLGDYPRAMADHDAVLKLAPRAAGAYTNACWVRALAKVELDDALEDCDLAVKGAREHRYSAYDTRGFLHYRRGEFDLAVADYDSALKEYPNLASSLYGRGLSKLRLGKTDEGRADLAAASKIEPGIAETYAKRGATP